MLGILPAWIRRLRHCPADINVLMNVLSTFLDRLRPVPSREVLRADLDDHGVSQTIDGSVVRILWEDVAYVVAYKRDCFTADSIRIIIGNEDFKIECSEDEQNFNELSAALRKYLPLKVPDWHERLPASPAFTSSTTVVYRRLTLEAPSASESTN